MLSMSLITYLTVKNEGDSVAVFLIAGLGLIEIIAELVLMFNLAGVK